MDFNTTIDIILKDLRDIREIIEDLKKYPGLPQLQVELARSKCKSAEEIIALLKSYKPTEGAPAATAPQPPVTETMKDEPSVKLKAETLFEIADEEPEEAPAPPLTIKAENKPDPEPVPGQTEKKVTGNIIADRFSGSSDTVFDKFGSLRKDEDISSALRTKPVEDLKDAIGLNDKFLFIREIFGGSQSQYEQAIGKLNKAGNLPDAKAIIMSYTGDNEENEVVQQLLEIVKRKLPSDG